MTRGHDTLVSAFEDSAWHDAVHALFEATGLAVTVMDRQACSVIHSVNHCSFCQVTTRDPNSVAVCFDDPPTVSDVDILRGTCRAGLPCYLAPLRMDGRHAATLVVGGFVSSTRERRRLFERLLAKGVSQPASRLAVREIPVLSRGQVEALVRMARTNGEVALARAGETVRWARRLRELELFADAGREFLDHPRFDGDMFDVILQRAMAIVYADGGSIMLLRPGTDLLEVVASCEAAGSPARDKVARVGEGIAGRVAATGRSVLVADGPEDLAERNASSGCDFQAAVSVPLVYADATIGVLNLDIADTSPCLDGEDLMLVEQYARMAATVINAAHEYARTKRHAFDIRKASELAKALASVEQLDEVTRVATAVLDRSLETAVVGVILTGWGRDSATVSLRGEVSRATLEDLLGQASGRDVSESPFVDMRYIAPDGVPTEDDRDDDWAMLSIELVVRDAVVGYLLAAARGSGVFAREDRELLSEAGEHVAVALARAAVLEHLREDLSKTRLVLGAALDAGEHVSVGHADRVTDYAIAIGEELGLPVEDIEALRFAGLLHDIGKTGLGEEILLKPSKLLTDAELARVRAHAEIGAGIVEQVEFLEGLKPVILHHHERWDGNGYPAGLAADDIPLLARVLAVADSFDVMTSGRAHRRRLSYADARRELLAGAGSQYDPRVVSAFLDAMDRRALAGGTGLYAEAPAQGPQLPA